MLEGSDRIGPKYADVVPHRSFPLHSDLRARQVSIMQDTGRLVLKDTKAANCTPRLFHLGVRPRLGLPTPPQKAQGRCTGARKQIVFEVRGKRDDVEVPMR